MEVFEIIYSGIPEDATPTNNETVYATEPLNFYPDQDVNGNTFQIIEVANGRTFWFLGTKAQLLAQLTNNKIII